MFHHTRLQYSKYGYAILKLMLNSDASDTKCGYLRNMPIDHDTVFDTVWIWEVNFLPSSDSLKFPFALNSTSRLSNIALPLRFKSLSRLLNKSMKVLYTLIESLLAIVYFFTVSSSELIFLSYVFIWIILIVKRVMISKWNRRTFSEFFGKSLKNILKIGPRILPYQYDNLSVQRKGPVLTHSTRLFM